MLQVLRHYLPLRKALLLAGENLLLTAVILAAMSSHLWQLSLEARRILAQEGLTPDAAFGRCAVSAFFVAVIAQFAMSLSELYDPRVSGSRYERASRFIGSAGAAIALVLASVLIAHAWGLERALDFPGLPLLSRVVFLTFTLALGFALLYLWRQLFHFVLARLAINERVLVLGAGAAARELADEILSRPDSGFEVVGLLEDVRAELRPAARSSQPGPAPEPPTPRETSAQSARGQDYGEEGAGQLAALCRRMRIDAIAVALEDRRAQLPMRELLACRVLGVRVEEAESLFERLAGKLAVQAMRPSYMVFNQGFAQNPVSSAAKRALDIGLALVLLVALSPFLLLTAICVRLDSPGPVLYRQERTGRHGRAFTLLKFRSMRSDAEAHSGPVWAKENDPRITRFGRFARKTRLDELPQLVNVLAGEMSLVGPRPERPKFVDELAEQLPYYGLRHVVKPGLTGWAQINYPYGNTVEDARQKLQFDLFYIKNQSLLFDLSILFNTIKTVVLRRGT